MEMMPRHLHHSHRGAPSLVPDQQLIWAAVLAAQPALSFNVHLPSTLACRRSLMLATDGPVLSPATSSLWVALLRPAGAWVQ